MTDTDNTPTPQKLKTLTADLNTSLSDTHSTETLDRQAQILDQIFTTILHEKVNLTLNNRFYFREHAAEWLDIALKAQKQCATAIKAKSAIQYMQTLTENHPPSPKIEKRTEGSQLLSKETKGWSATRRAKQAENCRKTRPEQHATGPKTPEGKAISAQNALKSGLHTMETKALKAALSVHREMLRALPAPPPSKQ